MLYQAVGGVEGCRKLSAAFYARVAQDPVLRPIFPGSFHCAIEHFGLFLAQLLGGACEYSQHRWWLSLHESHQRFRIGAKERDAWLANMRQAMRDVGIEESAYTALDSFFEVSSAAMVNRGDPVPCPGPIHPAVADQWEEQRLLDEIVAAVRRGEADHALALAGHETLRACWNRDPAALLSLFDLMIDSGNAAMLRYVHHRLRTEPALIRHHYTAGRTLLHSAAAAGRLPMLELLLHLGADPNATDYGDHTPLYSVGNGCSVGGGDVVRALAQAGAEVNANGGVKRCTPLHMAARRGNVEVAEALLDCGADLEARDSLGETPLRRAVNCAKANVAALLVRRGADVHSRSKKGVTPLLAARTAAMKQALGGAVS